MLRIPVIQFVLIAVAMLGSLAGRSQAFIAQDEKLPLETKIPSQGALSNQFSAFIVGEKPIALNFVTFSAYNKTEAKKISISVYKGSINGTNATLISKIASAVTMVETVNDFKTFTASFASNLMLDAWGVYYIVLKNESDKGGDISVAMASNIGAVKVNGVTAMSGVFHQDIPVTGNAKGLVDKNAFIGVSLNGPANAPTFSPPAPNVNLLRFSGAVQRGKAMLQWRIENGELLRSTVLEKSIDQKNFAAVQTAAIAANGNCIDGISGKAYYRLRMTDANGSVSYSKIVALETKMFFTAKLVQTQIMKGENVRIEISSSDALPTLITVVNRFGQPVKKISQQIMPGYNNIQFSTADLPAGNYYVKCAGGAGNEFVSEIQMIVL